MDLWIYCKPSQCILLHDDDDMMGSFGRTYVRVRVH